MNPPETPGLRAARALLDEEGRSDRSAAVVIHAFERVVGVLHRRLAPWIGADGCSRLLARGVLLAAKRHPALSAVTIQHTSPHVDGLEGLSKLSAKEARDAAESMIGAVVEHLGRLVGEAVALRVLLPETPEHWGPAPGDGDSP